MKGIGYHLKRELLEWLDAAMGVVPGKVGRLLRAAYWRTRLGELGPEASIGTGFCVLGARNVKIGKRFSCTGTGFMSAERGVICVGNHVALNNNVHINTGQGGKIDIGNDVLIGANCVLRASDHSFSDLEWPMRMQGHEPGKIVLEDDVCLGANVVVASGVRIGQGAVVTAGAVVTEDVEAGSIVGGVPAKFLKKRASLDSSYL